MVGRYEILIAVKHRLAEIGVHHVAAVHEEILQGVALAGVSGLATKPEIFTSDVSVATGMSCFSSDLPKRLTMRCFRVPGRS